MESDLRGEDILFQVKEKLNNEKIKLWLEPYYKSINGVGETNEEALQQLCDQFLQQLNIDKAVCITALRNLQKRALERLESNRVYKESGTASLRVKVSGEIPTLHSFNIQLTASTSQLLEEIAKEINISPERIKLISQGKVLLPSEPLGTQGVKNTSLLMAVILAADNQLQESEKRFKTLESTKKDVKLLVDESSMNGHYLEVENQAGEVLTLPPHERKALVMAIALHEKGRVALKQGDYSLALVIFLEADKGFSKCTSELLQSVDNYALLNLDISWCYLCLRNPVQIPDADRRLSLCEKNFRKTYGPNLERLMAIKGATGNEAALFMRLHLMQGVVLFHQNKRAEAKQMFEKAQSELTGLKLDDNKLSLLLELGYTNAEARLGLRATHGNIELAEELISRKRREKTLAAERNRIKLIEERKRIQLGLCANGKDCCNPSFVENMVRMGFDHRKSVEALKLTNNSISEAINIIQDQPHILPSSSHTVSEEMVAQVSSLGFDPNMAREALLKHPELEKTVTNLSNLNQAQVNDAVVAACASINGVIEELGKKRKAKEDEVQQAFQRVSEGLIANDLAEDHLDINLDQEEQFLIEYLSLLNN